MIFSIFVSFIWSCINEAVLLLVRLGVLKPKELGIRTLSVGNVQVGGAGKTPLVAKIASEFVLRAKERGRLNSVVCILTRGYGGTWEQMGGLLLPGETTGEFSEAKVCGDEPALLHELVPEALIAVGAERLKQFEKAQEWAKANHRSIDLVVLDDGFQHWRIARDLDIVAITGDRWGQNVFRNFYGTIKRSLGRERVLIWTKGNRPPSALSASIRVEYDYSNLEQVLVTTETNKGYWLVAGVAGAQQVRGQLQSLGIPIERQFSFADHASYEREEVLQILEDAEREDRKILITGKDWVKWKKWMGALDLARCIRIEPVLRITEGGEIWKEMLWKNS